MDPGQAANGTDEAAARARALGKPGPRFDPLWAKAPLLLLRFRALFVAVASGAMLLVLAASSSPLFVSATAGSALADKLEDVTTFGAGISVTHDDAWGGTGFYGTRLDAVAERYARANKRILDALDGTGHLAAPVFTVLGAFVRPSTEPGRSAQRELRLFARTGALAHVHKLARSEGDGVWIADEAAKSMRLGPGDEIYLANAGTPLAPGSAERVKVRIDGIYRALWKQPLTPYWRALSQDIYPRSADAGPPPTFLIASESQAFGLSTTLGELYFPLRWEWPLDTTSLTLPAAEELDRRFARFEDEALDPTTTLGRLFECPECPAGQLRPRISYSSLLGTAIRQAKEARSSLRGPVDLLSTAGILVAVAVVAGAGIFVMARRRAEATLLFARGTSPAAVGLRTAVEATLPASAGALVGLGAAYAVVRGLGPEDVDGRAIRDAATLAVLAVPVSAVLVGLTAAIVFARKSERPRTGLRRFTTLPWELAALAAAAFFFHRIRGPDGLSGGEREAGGPSMSLLLFPILFTAGGAGLAARVLHRPLRALRGRSERLPAAALLTVRRLAGAQTLALLLVTGCALALGMLVYAQTVVRSFEETVKAKSFLFVGSDVQGITSADRELSDAFPLPATRVTKMVDRGYAGGVPVDVMAVDPETIASAAYWDASWARRPLAAIARDLRDRGVSRLAVVIAGEAPGEALELDGVSIPLEVVERADAFPGMSPRRPLVVADRRALERLAKAGGSGNPVTATSSETQVWVKGDTRRAVAALQTSNVRPFPLVTAEEVRKNPHIRSVTQTFSFLQALGLGAGLLTVVGTLLYLQARQRNRVISAELARRMGLTERSHRLSLALELAAMLLSALAIGAALAVVAARLVVPELDGPARIPSGPLYRTPWWVVAAAAVALLAASLFGALLTHRSARRANVAEVMRSGE